MQPGSMAALLQSALTDPSPRSRLIAAMAAALCERSYAALSVADVVRIARVSKRTYYEHFATREACYLATYEMVSEQLLDRIAQAATLDLPVHDQLAAAARAYLSALEEVPELARTFLLEIQLAGAAALAARRKVHQRFADVLRTLVAEASKQRPELRMLSPNMAVAIVGAINELLMLRIEQGRMDQLTPLTATVVELFEALLLRTPLQAETTKRKRDARA